MGSPDLGTLELVDVRKIWHHEERDFTPWLADNLLRLSAVLDMNLELVATEDRKPEAGRADIMAKDTGSGANVVIKNQLDWSDDSHLARLLGYAASRDAQVVIWISTGFWKWHLDILDWLGKAGVEIYGIELSAWRIGDVVAPHFELMAGSGGRLERAEEGPATGACSIRSLLQASYPPASRSWISADGRQAGRMDRQEPDFPHGLRRPVDILRAPSERRRGQVLGLALHRLR